MFTGIITAVGSLASRVPRARSVSLEVACDYEAIVLGESIAVDGVCLTVAKIVRGGFVADLSAETLERTTLREARNGARVNLERALAVGDRLGGHIVAGHVDGVGRVRACETVGDAERWTVEADADVLRFIAVKGSVAVDGVSLTVNGLGPTAFELMLVPFTLAATALKDKAAGASVNLEADVLARYVRRALESPTGDGGGVTMDLLVRNGFASPGDR